MYLFNFIKRMINHHKKYLSSTAVGAPVLSSTLLGQITMPVLGQEPR